MTPVFIRPCAMSSKTTLNDAMKTLQVFNPCIGLATLTSILHLLPPTSITRRSHQMLSNPRQTGRPCARHNYMDKTSNLTIYAFLAVYIYISFKCNSLSTQLALQEIKFLGFTGSPWFTAFLCISSILQVAATQLATKSQRLLGHRAVSMARGVSTHRGDGGLCQVGRFRKSWMSGYVC